MPSVQAFVRYAQASGPQTALYTNQQISTAHTISVLPNSTFDVTVRVQGVERGQKCRVSLARTDRMLYDQVKDGFSDFASGDLVFLISNIRNDHAVEGYAFSVVVNNPLVPVPETILGWTLTTMPIISYIAGLKFVRNLRNTSQVIYRYESVFQIYDSSKKEYDGVQLQQIREQLDKEAQEQGPCPGCQQAGQAGADFAKNIADFFIGVGNALGPYLPYILIGAVVIIAGPTIISSTVSGLVRGR